MNTSASKRSNKSDSCCYYCFKKKIKTWNTLLLNLTKFWFKVSLEKDKTEIISLVDRGLLQKEEGWPELGSTELHILSLMLIVNDQRQKIYTR